jgi:hypothetical protein
MLKLSWRISAVMLVCVFAFVGCRSLTGRSFGQHWDDKTITAQVKTRLSTDRSRNLFSTGVGTQYGVVHLTGNVATPEERAEAERIAGRVKGVKGVVNDIVVVPRDGRMAGTPVGPNPAASPTSTPGTTR